MVHYEIYQEIIEESLKELVFIINWINERENDLDNPITVLIGGWAVDAYNPWYGSVDIDLVTNNRTKNHLKQILFETRGYERLKSPLVNTVYKPIKEDQQILIDFANKHGHHKFEGRTDELNLRILDDNTVKKMIRGSVSASVPSRSLLLLLKLKAVWDREYRVENNRTSIIEYEKSKIIKDYADVIALLDPESGGHEIDTHFLGEKIDQFDFLRDIIKSIPNINDAINMYGRMNKDQVKNTIDKLLSLI